MRRLTVGILAHVDAGKTTLSEAILYRGGALRSLSPAQMMKEGRLFRLFSTLPRLTEFTDLREGQRMGASGERGHSSHPQRTPGSMSPGYAHVGGDRQ